MMSNNLPASHPILDEESDSLLAPEAEDTWIEVKMFSIHIIRTDEGVGVDVYAAGFEDCTPLTSCRSTDNEAQEMQATSCRRIRKR